MRVPSSQATTSKKVQNHQGRGITRTPIEHLVEYVLNGTATGPDAPDGLRDLATEVMDFEPRDTRVVILGGGTGLSTVVGGNSQLAEWADHPFVGLKQEFSRLDVMVCTTDDGGSTCLLLKHLPVIGIGDLRKSCLSLIRQENLQKSYDLDADAIKELVRLIQTIFNYRLGEKEDEPILFDPLLAAPPVLRKVCPKDLAAFLRVLGRYVSPGGKGPTVNPAGHCLGNLLLTSAIFRAAKGRTDRPPNLREIRAGLDEVASFIGVTPGHLHAATCTPGQLKFLYANGVEVYGQSKSAHARRGFPVERCTAEFTGTPQVSATVLRDIKPSHLGFFRGTRIISARNWNRRTEWDNVLGYYDREDRYIKLHESLITNPMRLRNDMLVALGESLLGNYIESSRWLDNSCIDAVSARSYEIVLRPPHKRECFLSDALLCTYLHLARMLPDPANPHVLRITINNDEGFLPPGLLFGLTYAWYLDNSYGTAMEYEMALLRWAPEFLIPHQAKERIRKEALVTFFRTEIFGHGDKNSE